MMVRKVFIKKRGTLGGDWHKKLHSGYILLRLPVKMQVVSIDLDWGLISCICGAYFWFLHCTFKN